MDCREQYLACIENDISKQVNKEEECQKAYMDTEMILNELTAPICIVSKSNNCILSCNTAFMTMYSIKKGYSMIGKPITDFLTIGVHANSSYIVNKLHAGMVFKSKMKREDASFIDIEVSSHLFFYQEQEAFVIHCIDLTKQKIHEQTLRNAVIAAEEASRTKTAFLFNMSHEIRTPMNGVIGFTELALDEEGLSPKVREYLEKIKISADGLLQIINAVLDVSKIEAGKMELEKVPFSLQEVFVHCETVSSVKALDKGVGLYFYSETEFTDRLIGDPTRLRQVLLNLLSNAIKFTDKGMVKVTANANELEDGKVGIHFEVKDTGIGISEEQMEKIFIPFMQADNSTTRKYGGTGLGLAITKSLIELMGGELEVKSTAGVGSVFSFTLSFDILKEPEPIPKTNEFVLREIKKPVFSGKVLVCEDNTMNQQVICEHLLRIGLDVVIASNGKEGIDLAQRHESEGKPFDAILMDIHMPVMDGLEAIQYLSENGNQTPIIAMTANAMSKDIEGYLKHGLSDYITKPFKARELWSCLRKYLNVVDFSGIPLTLIEKVAPLLKSGSSQCLEFLDQIEEMLLPVGDMCNILVAEMKAYDFDLAYETIMDISALLKERE